MAESSDNDIAAAAAAPYAEQHVNREENLAMCDTDEKFAFDRTQFALIE